MAEAAVTFLLEQVKEVTIGYKDLISGAEDELHRLGDELDLFKAFLMDVARTDQKQTHLFGELEKHIKDAVYKVEDTIDACLSKVVTAKAKSSSRLRLSSSRRINLAKEIKAIREDLVDPMIKDAYRMSSMMQLQSADGSSRIEPTATKTGQAISQIRVVVGFEDEVATITSYLMEAKDVIDVISIIGIPGQGKTTLAWKVYQNEDIHNHFPIRIWVNVFQKFNIRDLLIQILRKFIPSQDTASLTNDGLIKIVRGCLEKEKFLLVLDDVWSVDAWLEIEQALPLGNGQAKVLITSREMAVGVHSSVRRKPHSLRFLTKEESWTLLQYVVFGNLADCPEKLRDIGMQLAYTCDGVPLTIAVVGGMLTISSSKAVSTREWEVMVGHISAALQSDMARRITEVVALSYERLPHELRQCFVFLGVFPEGYAIPAKTLCRLWIAEGFIQPETGISLEESADKNLNDLICRNLLQVDKLNHLGKVKKCKVHDMIRAFCVDKAMEENLFREIKESHTGAFEPPVSEVQNFHRLCFRSSVPKFLSATPSGPHVRSFLCFYNEPIELGPEQISIIPEKFPKLRILESMSMLLDQFPETVSTLIHLRYLTLFVDNLKIIPASIAQIWNLQALVVKTKSPTIVMEANLWGMIRLRYLNTKAAIVLAKEWEGAAGHNLQTLNRLSPKSCTEVICEKAKHLKTMGISGELAIIFNENFLEKLHNLQRLKLVNSSADNEASSKHMLHGLPQSNCFPPHLKSLTLANTFLGWKHMSTLAMIKTLESLKLKDNAFVGVSWNVGRDKFSNLQILLIVTTDLVLWDPSTDSFPSLRCLVVKNCEKLREIPECLGTNLEKLEIDRVRYSVAESARKIAKTNYQCSLIIGPDCFIK